jgi:hypothetical protein
MFLTTLSSNQVIWLQGFFGSTYCFVTLCPSMVLDLSTDKLNRVSELLNIVIYLVYLSFFALWSEIQSTVTIWIRDSSSY